jgi:hypothetical protein
MFMFCTYRRVAPMIQLDLSLRPAPVDAHPNRGRLNNGNPPGDYMKAPRCGAKTRTGGCACRQPAMRNGRCRFHGGKSTGARTAAGRARCARARRTHGFYSAETVALRREAQTLLRRNRDLLAALRGRPAGHGVLRSFSRSRSARPAKDAKPPMNADERRCASLAPGAETTPINLRSSASVCGSNSLSDRQSEFRRPTTVPAGHGVLRSILRFAARRLGLNPGARA